MSDVALVLLLLIVLALIWRGPKTLPKLGQALGRGIREARREAQELTGGQAGAPGEGGTPAGEGGKPPAEPPGDQSRDG
ncbi:MAG TPA: twin-arginine translocase TatA/TatE family subunit [Candidatus Binatia bacterium]|nr:twin-arginine translocase TatA/TatE family subunit [Candidatus Binatia bacterium]